MRLRNIPGAQDAILESPYVVQEPQTKKGHWGEVFVKKQPLHIEVGMGKGRFLMDLARLHPDINYIGIEMYDSVLLRALQKREELEENGEAYSNLFFMRVDARLLPEIFEKGEVDKIYLNFSDPWPKARHAKRRLTSSWADRALAALGSMAFRARAYWGMSTAAHSPRAASHFRWCFVCIKRPPLNSSGISAEKSGFSVTTSTHYTDEQKDSQYVYRILYNVKKSEYFIDSSRADTVNLSCKTHRECCFILCGLWPIAQGAL